MATPVAIVSVGKFVFETAVQRKRTAIETLLWLARSESRFFP